MNSATFFFFFFSPFFNFLCFCHGSLAMLTASFYFFADLKVKIFCWVRSRDACSLWLRWRWGLFSDTPSCLYFGPWWSFLLLCLMISFTALKAQAPSLAYASLVYIHVLKDLVNIHLLSLFWCLWFHVTLCSPSRFLYLFLIDSRLFSSLHQISNLVVLRVSWLFIYSLTVRRILSEFHEPYVTSHKFIICMKGLMLIMVSTFLHAEL